MPTDGRTRMSDPYPPALTGEPPAVGHPGAIARRHPQGRGRSPRQTRLAA